MAHSRRTAAVALLRRSLRVLDYASPATGGRALTAVLAAGERTDSEGKPRWRTRAGVVAAAGGVAGFLSLLQPVAAQQVATETLDARKDTPRNLSADTVTRLLAELRAACDEARVVVDVEERELHAKPWNTYHSVDAIPDIVVHPKSQEEVVAIVKACEKYKVPVTPFAGGTSLEGHTMTPYKGVSINMNSMKKVKELHLEDMDVVVEPGIGWIELNQYLKPYGLFFPLDPGPGATIGGMCATRCSGSMAVRLL